MEEEQEMELRFITFWIITVRLQTKLRESIGLYEKKNIGFQRIINFRGGWVVHWIVIVMELIWFIYQRANSEYVSGSEAWYAYMTLLCWWHWFIYADLMSVMTLCYLKWPLWALWILIQQLKACRCMTTVCWLCVVTFKLLRPTLVTLKCILASCAVFCCLR